MSVKGDIVSQALPQNDIGQGALTRMSFIPQGNTFIQKGGVVVEEGEEGDPMLGTAKIVDPMLFLIHARKYSQHK